MLKLIASVSFQVNYENVVGAVGFVSVLFPTLLPLGLIKVDRETGKEIRDSNGLCIRCGPGEPGEFVGLIQVCLCKTQGLIFISFYGLVERNLN